MKFQFCLAKPEEGGVALDDLLLKEYLKLLRAQAAAAAALACLLSAAAAVVRSLTWNSAAAPT